MQGLTRPLSALILSALAVLAGARCVSAAVLCQNIPSFSGEVWAAATTDDTYVVISVFQDSTNQWLLYHYRPETSELQLFASGPSEAIVNGHRVRSGSSEWHTYERQGTVGNLRLYLDGTTELPLRSIPQNCSGQQLFGLGCLIQCYGNCFPVPGDYSCCDCCFCVHMCLNIENADPICCGGSYEHPTCP